jgi:tetratricopeptide (TPR) repeat protein
MKNQASATSRAAGQTENRGPRPGFGLPALQKDKPMAPDDDIWDTNPGDTVVDRDALAGRLQTCSALERVWILALMGRGHEAVEEGQALLAGSTHRLYPLLVLAHVFQSQHRWQEAARLHEEALRLARTPIREATVRHQIGKRLFGEGKYRDAAAEFEWARDLFRSCGHRHGRTQASERAMDRARKLAARPTPGQQHIQAMATERRKPPAMHEAGISVVDTDRYP